MEMLEILKLDFVCSMFEMALIEYDITIKN